MAPSDQDVEKFLYDQLREEIIHCLNDYIDNGRGSLDELKNRFRRFLTEEVRNKVENVRQLVDALERQGVIGQNDVKIIKLLAEKIGLKALEEKIKEYEYDCSGFITKIFKGAAGAVKTSAIRLKTVLSRGDVLLTALAAGLVAVYKRNPKILEDFQTFLDLRAQLLDVRASSVVFVLKVSSIASIKQLWKGYKDGSLKKSMKKDLNEMKELKELSKGEEIDVELTIDEEECREVLWNLIISEVKANDARQNDEKQPTLSRRHSIGCEQDVPKSSSLPGGSQLHIQAWRHIDELNKVLSNFKSIKAKKETSEDTAIALKEVVSMVEQEEKRLSEIRQELSELNIVIDATGFEKVKVEENAGLSVEGIDSGASTSLQAEKDKKQSDQSTQVPHPDQMTGDEKLSSAADARKAGEKLEEQSVVAICDKERMSETQQLLLKERFPFFKDDVIPTELLDKLPCLTNEQKDQIANDEKNHLPSKSVETLVEKLKEHKEGFEQFVEALRKAELGHVAALLDANYFDIPIIVRIKGQIKLEREIASKFSNSLSKEAKKLRQDFEKMLPRGIYFVRTKLMEDVSAKDEGTKTTGAQDVPQSTEDSLAVIFRLNKINLLDKLWEMYKYRRLDAVFRSVWSKELSSSFVHLFFRKEDYDECEKTLKEDVKAHSTPIALESSAVGSYTSIQVASPLKEYLDKEGYNNWLKVGFTLDLIRKELQSHIETEIKAFHRKMIAKLEGFPLCICSYMPSRRPNPYHDMKTCSWAKELEKHHRKQSPAWNQSDALLWKHRDVGHWEVAKLFISPQAIVKKEGVDLEINDLLTILSTCDHFEIDEAVVQDLKTVRNAWVHAVSQEIDKEKIKTAFEKMKRFLNETKVLADQKQLKKVELLETEPLVFRETKVTHDKVERMDLGASTSLQAEKERKMAAFMEFSMEELNHFRVCYVTTRILPDSLRTVFKQEWNNRYQATYGTWQDTAKNGIDFYNMESIRSRKTKHRELAVIRNGNTCDWDSACLFYAILYSDSVGKGLDPGVRKSVDDLRQFRNYVAHIPDGKLNESDFNSNIKKVITAFASLKLSTADIEDISIQRLSPTEELHNIEEQLCVLPTKPNHQVIDRSDEVREIQTQMERLRSTKPNEITVIYLSGSPGCGKSEIARQVGEKLFKDASDHATKFFVFTLDALSHDTLISSYVELAISLKCDKNFVTSIQMSKDLSQEDKLIFLKSFVAPKLQNYSASWLIIVDNVTEVNSVLRYLPQAGEKTEGKGQMLVTTQNSISISPDDSYAYHLSLSKGMSRGDALRMLSEISNIVDEEETTFEIAKALDFQPLALAFAANYMKRLRIDTPTLSWKEYGEKLEATEGEFEKISVAYSQPMTAAVRLAVEKEMADGVMKHAFHFLSVVASKLTPLESVVQYVKRLIPDEDEELVADHITSSSLILSSESKEIGVHQVVGDSCLQIFFKAS